MRILHVYRTYFPDTQGGLEEAIRQICRATGALGARNSVFTLSEHARPATIAMPEAEVLRVPQAFEIASCGFATPRGVRQFGQAAARHDLIHYHYPWPFADLLHASLRARRPALATYHSDVVRQRLLGALYRPLRDRFLGSLQRVVATSPQYAASSPVLAALGGKVSVIPLTIDPASYPPADPAAVEAWRARLGEPFFLFVGVLRYYKGLDYLIEAARGLPCAVAIAGQGPESARLRRAAAGLGNVHFLGHVSDADKMALIGASRAIVFPSHLRSEAFGMTLLEGAMLGRALISCEIGTGTSHVNRDGDTGLVVPAGDAAALAQAMRRLAAEPSTAARMGLAARARFEALFSSAAVGRAYCALYRELAPGTGRAAAAG